LSCDGLTGGERRGGALPGAGAEKLLAGAGRRG
jgi:hypothetical protein